MGKAWSDEVQWGAIPERMRGPIARYVENGIKPGSFLCSVIKNDLLCACLKADVENRHLIPAYVKLFTTQCPAACFGSEADMRAWLAHRGISGAEASELQSESA